MKSLNGNKSGAGTSDRPALLKLQLLYLPATTDDPLELSS